METNFDVIPSSQQPATRFSDIDSSLVEQEDYPPPRPPLRARPVFQRPGGTLLDEAVGDRARPASSITASTTSSASSVEFAVMESHKRPAPEDQAPPPAAKHVKSEHPEEFSEQVKKRLASSTRTGQACDRCKVRKIRCDGLPGGCSPCLINSSPCQTTDRITGRATIRGYTEGLEAQLRQARDRIQELEQSLAQGGVPEIRPLNGYSGGGVAPNYEYNQSIVQATPSAWNPTSPSQHGIQPMPKNPAQETNMFRVLPNFRAGCVGDNYLGVATGNLSFSSIKGTALSILGMEINIADFDSADMDEPDGSSPHPHLYNKSYQAFLQTSLNIHPPIERPALPEWAHATTYVDWYFRLVNPYLPILHEPTFLEWLRRIYEDPNSLTTAETVMVHMVFAIIYFQYATRNFGQANIQADQNTLSNNHYHYSLSKFYQLIRNHTFQDIQALTLICAHLRNFPKPGASWILTQMTMSLAIELGLHRSVNRWVTRTKPNPLEVEMRKRTFWALLTIHVTLSGKLGRPMTFREEDFDVELPEAYDDNSLSENGLDTTKEGKCSYEIALQAFSLIPMFMEMYNTVYAVRPMSHDNYMATVDRLESKLSNWQENIPRALLEGNTGEAGQGGRVFALYIEMWGLEFRILLRHPSVSLTNDPAFNAKSMQICAESSHRMLDVVQQLMALNSLDTTWCNCAVYVMAITTTLFAHWEKGEPISVSDLAALKEEMDAWLEIMGKVGALLGSGDRLREAIHKVTTMTLYRLSRNEHLQQNKNGVLPKTPVPGSTPYIPAQNYSYVNTPPSSGHPAPNQNYPSGGSQLAHQHTPYPAATQYSSYPDPTPLLAYTPQDHPQTYNTYASGSNTPDGALLAALPTQASPAQVSAANGWRRPPPTNSGPNPWQQWAHTIAGNLEPEDSYSASALIQLGRDGPANGLPSASASMSPTGLSTQGGLMEHAVVHNGGHLPGQGNGGVPMTWPLNIFDINQSNQPS